MDQPSQPTPSIDVPECLRRWRARDERAAEELIRHLYPLISRIVRRHLPRRDTEEDLVQEVLMKMFARLSQYKADVPLEHWVSRIAVTTCIDRLRAQKIRPETTWTDLTPEEGEVFDLSFAGHLVPDSGRAIEARDLIDKILSPLPAADRALILMADLEGRSIEEISRVVGGSISKTKMRLFRLRGRLREFIHKLEKPEHRK